MIFLEVFPGNARISRDGSDAIALLANLSAKRVVSHDYLESPGRVRISEKLLKILATM
ncbi:hypothetical protein [Nocardia sp. NPDC052566]|uniref:hypothetical protein n=1 Tax=Nocardia sp. NPDC052566 TaxID=3364330 RepID=UPI0037C652F2